MRKHILTFSHLKEEDYPDPKDKLKWKIDLESESKYKCHKQRYIATTDDYFDRYKLPVNLPEEEWN